MIKNIVIVIFILLYYGNLSIANYFITPDTWDSYYDNNILRHKVFEFMFLAFAVLPFLKANKWTKTIAIFAIVPVVCSMLDKFFNGIYSRVPSDLFVPMVSVLVAITYHNIIRKLNPLKPKE